jgi:hypothetical protein
MVPDRARLLLANLGVEQITDDALRLMLAFDSCGSRKFDPAGFAR